ncbi:glutamate--cysteine ligase [Azomonas macrocytogenes]|uniref:Glutamate--cysteine ligase n=1 Tax=Azomonas macrocytogenes TaxID=69962 RepID=A0A839T664_AZOMA|nr:glutamate--cysteine ligase [Azomonas macrocytogenes]MBB3103173.1 hypothetical protein [Azomonas macrocytogenes]
MTDLVTMPPVKCGIEFEYMLVDRHGPQAGCLRDFTNLDFTHISQILEDKPGREDGQLATGDMGVRSGYWYIEGDERFHADGSFNTFAVKGVEIRTPPEDSVEAAVARLLEIERQLAQRLELHGFGLAITALNPLRASYDYSPPLNDFEKKLRAEDHEYDGTDISTLTYGPDINLSLPEWDMWHNLDAARKLNYYAPYIVPFSFGSPFFAGAPWHGLSRRTWMRCEIRPAVKLFLEPEELPIMADYSVLVRPARLAREAGRIEFKAFDAMPSVELLTACSYLLVGMCLSKTLRGRSEVSNVALYQRAALTGFADDDIHAGARTVLEAACNALDRVGNARAVAALAPLERMLAERTTPAHAMRAEDRMFHSGGLAGSRTDTHDSPAFRVAAAD